jgi:hypothetical protein
MIRFNGLLLLLFVLGSCNKQSENSTNRNTKSNKPGVVKKPEVVKKPQVKKCRANEYMKFPPLKYLSEKEKSCEKNSDCIVSSLIPGNCCSHGCNQRWVYTRTFLTRAIKYMD